MLVRISMVENLCVTIFNVSLTEVRLHITWKKLKKRLEARAAHLAPINSISLASTSRRSNERRVASEGGETK